jgi:hypothetical protein
MRIWKGENVNTIRYISFIVLLGLACSVTFAQSVNTDYKEGTDFSAYKTYAWGESPHPIDDPLWNERIIAAVDAELAAKGMRKVDLDQNPDVIVVYSAGIQQNVTYQGYAMGWYNRMGSIQRVIENEGTLIVDFADPHTKMMTWRGVARDTLADKSDKNKKKLQKMVSKMFKKYPPK